ncbi:MAG: radical SAM protein, partial [Calditrichaeota bacterium]
FVIDQPEDCDEVRQYLEQFPEIDPSRVLLMPQGTDAEQLRAVGAWLEPYCRQHGVGFCPRRQIEWFGLVRGT